MKLLPKITAKDILGNIIEIVKSMEVGERRQAYAVAGTCDAYEIGMSTYGEWCRFVGNFEAVNYIVGEVARAPKVHVPDVLEQILRNGVAEAAEVVASKSTKTTQFFKLDAPVEFAYVVELERMADDEKEGIKYKFVTSPKTEVARNDSIGHLTGLLPRIDGVDEKPVEKSEKKADTKKAK